MARELERLVPIQSKPARTRILRLTYFRQDKKEVLHQVKTTTILDLRRKP